MSVYREGMKFAVVVAGAMALTSCAPVVRRWTLGGAERAGVVMPISSRPDIFADFLWTTPPIRSRPLVFVGPVARMTFAGESVAFIRDADGGLTLARGSTRQSAYRRLSSQDRYFSLEELGTKLVPKQRLVTRSKWVQQLENVTKTRMVSRSVPVSRTRAVSSYNSTTHSTQTHYESYTEYQTQMVSESYTAQEMRGRWQLYTVWETVMERVVDIPSYDYYEFVWDEGSRLLVYEIPRGDGSADYFLQNPTYLTGHDTEQALLDGNVAVLAIDANSNGIYFEADDRLLFNSWNPYLQDSAYREVTAFMDNRWYRQSDLLRHHLLRIGATVDRRGMEFESPNQRFNGVTTWGQIAITNVPLGASTIMLNGRVYSSGRDGSFKAQIEYGVYLMRIASPGLVDVTDVFTVDAEHSVYERAYQPPQAAGILNIQNVSVDNYKVVIEDQDGLVAVHEQATTVFLPAGNYDVTVSAGGYEVAWNVNVHPDIPVTVDYDAEVSAREGRDTDSQASNPAATGG